MVQKELDFRKEYHFDSKQRINANYYPMTSAIAIRDYNSTNKDVKT